MMSFGHATRACNEGRMNQYGLAIARTRLILKLALYRESEHGVHIYPSIELFTTDALFWRTDTTRTLHTRADIHTSRKYSAHQE